MVTDAREIGEAMTIWPVYLPAARPEVATETANVAGVLLLAVGVTVSHDCTAAPAYCTWAVTGTLPLPPVEVTVRFCAAGAARPMVKAKEREVGEAARSACATTFSRVLVTVKLKGAGLPVTAMLCAAGARQPTAWVMVSVVLGADRFPGLTLKCTVMVTGLFPAPGEVTRIVPV